MSLWPRRQAVAGNDQLTQQALLETLKALVTQSCPTLRDPRDYSPPGSSDLEFSRQEYWSGLPFLSPGDLPDPGIKSRSPALQADSFTV